MPTKRYFSLKLREDFFSSLKIKKLRRIAGGDTLTIIYLKIQLLSIKNEGVIRFTAVEDTFEEELALALDEDVDNVRMTLLYLQNQGMIERIDDDEYLIPSAAENVGSESESAARMRKLRDKCTVDKEIPSHCDADVRGCDKNVTTEIEKEKDIEIELEREESAQPALRRPSPYQKVMEMYNSICAHYPKVNSMSDSRKKAVKARINAGMTAKDFQTLFEKAEASSFLRGKNSRNWRATFDWLIKDANMAKVLDGNYDDRKTSAASNGHGAPSYDLEAFERQGFDLPQL